MFKIEVLSICPTKTLSKFWTNWRWSCWNM